MHGKGFSMADCYSAYWNSLVHVGLDLEVYDFCGDNGLGFGACSTYMIEYLGNAMWHPEGPLLYMILQTCTWYPWRPHVCSWIRDVIVLYVIEIYFSILVYNGRIGESDTSRATFEFHRIPLLEMIVFNHSSSEQAMPTPEILRCSLMELMLSARSQVCGEVHPADRPYRCQLSI